MNRFWMTAPLALMGVTIALNAEAAGAVGVAAPVEQMAGAPTPGNVATSVTGVMVGSSLDAVRVYPNPWRADKHSGQSITFDHVPPAATIKLFTIAGQFIKILDADDNGAVSWDLTNDSGVKVASGIYLYLISTDDGQDSKGKLAIIR